MHGRVEQHRAHADPLAEAVDRDDLALLARELVRQEADRLDQVGDDDEARQPGGLGEPAAASDRLAAPSLVEALADPLLVVMIDAADLEVGVTSPARGCAAASASRRPARRA
jgi:hypothetical protein